MLLASSMQAPIQRISSECPISFGYWALATAVTTKAVPTVVAAVAVLIFSGVLVAQAEEATSIFLGTDGSIRSEARVPTTAIRLRSPGVLFPMARKLAPSGAAWLHRTSSRSWTAFMVLPLGRWSTGHGSIWFVEPTTTGRVSRV